MPQPTKGEGRKRYVSRCIAHYTKKGLTGKQAAGKCHGMWRSHKKGKRV